MEQIVEVNGELNVEFDLKVRIHKGHASESEVKRIKQMIERNLRDFKGFNFLLIHDKVEEVSTLYDEIK